MNSDTDESHNRIVLDTNILVSDIIYGGKPQIITNLVIKKILRGFSSPPLLAELLRILKQKFNLSEEQLDFVEKKVRKNFKFVQPSKRIKAIHDDPDNRVLEAAVEGNCDFIVTGDRDLLKLKKYKRIKILTPHQFLEEFSEK